MEKERKVRKRKTVRIWKENKIFIYADSQEDMVFSFGGE